MHNLTRLPHNLDRQTGACRAVIETPKGGRAKYDFDPHLKQFVLKTMLPEGMSFPLDFGFIPSTLCDDGDPLDVMVLVDEPSFAGAVIDVRLIGAMEAEEVEHGHKERNDRLIAVAAVSHLYADVKTVADLPAAFIDHLSEFWINKDRLEGKGFKVIGVAEPMAAVELVRKGSRLAKKAA